MNCGPNSHTSFQFHFDVSNMILLYKAAVKNDVTRAAPSLSPGLSDCVLQKLFAPSISQGFSHPKRFQTVACSQQSSWGLNPTVHQIHNLCCLPRWAYLDSSSGKFPAFTCFIAGCALPYLRVSQSFTSFPERLAWMCTHTVSLMQPDRRMLSLSSGMKHLWQQLQVPLALAVMSQAFSHLDLGIF